MRARVDVHGAGAHDELGGVVELCRVEQLLRFGQRGLVEPLHALHHLRRGGGCIEGKVDIHLGGGVCAQGCAYQLDLELLKALKAELFAKAVDARDGDIGLVRKFLDGEPANVLTHGENRLPELLLGGGEPLALGDFALDIHMAPMHSYRDVSIITVNKTPG